jgi:hypothetical protein
MVSGTFKTLARRLEHFVKPLLSIQPVSSDGLPHLVGNLPDWQSVLKGYPEYEKVWNEAASGDLVLIPTSVGGFTPGVVIESLLGVALKLRGVNVHFLLCDAMMPACLQVHLGKVEGAQTIVDRGLKDVACPGCERRGTQVLQSTGLPLSFFSDYISADKAAQLRQLAETIPFDEIADYRIGAVTLGEHARAGALRFFSSGHLPAGRDGEMVLRRYFEAALVTHEVTVEAIRRLNPSCAVFNHGIYVPQGIIGNVARAAGVRVVNWNVAYRKKSFIFSHHETYHHTLIDEPVEVWENIEWNEGIDEALTRYLRSRWYGTEDWIWFHDQPQHDVSAIANETGIDFSKPLVTALTNVFWDAQLHYKANAFKDMLDWLLQTIEYFKGREDLQLAIRIHPAEVRGAIPSRQPIEAEIRKHFPVLPRNVFVIPAESQASTYALCEHSDSVIIYGTKTGVELSAFGIPVVVAGEAWIRNKGLTIDAVSPESYFRILDSLPVRQRLSGEQTLRAKKYAYHFFFRRFIPLNCVSESERAPPFEIRIGGMEDLLPGADPGLDVICNGIINGTEFVYPAELNQQ